VDALLHAPGLGFSPPSGAQPAGNKAIPRTCGEYRAPNSSFRASPVRGPAGVRQTAQRPWARQGRRSPPRARALAGRPRAGRAPTSRPGALLRQGRLTHRSMSRTRASEARSERKPPWPTISPPSHNQTAPSSSSTRRARP
jgi:hypothetical protein